MKSYVGFKSWDGVLAHITVGKRIYYHAPLDVNPRLIQCEVKGNEVRVAPLSSDCDPFTADSGHLDRFKKAES